MTEPTWAPLPRPAPGSSAARLGRWEPATPADLTHLRLQLSSALHDGARPPRTTAEAVDDLLLVVEELVSNALRHGRPPVVVELHTTDEGWLLDVSDAAPAVPPVTAVGRDAAQGGLGLFLVARLSTAHGWTVQEGRKHVWARIGRMVEGAPGAFPRPRSGEDPLGA
jgi:signal transduction histidine kinase